MDQNSSKFIYYYVGLTTGFVLLYVCAVTFMSIPKENVRFVDTVLGFLLGTVLSGGISYFLGGTNTIKHKPSDGTTSADISATITTTTQTDDKNKQG